MMGQLIQLKKKKEKKEEEHVLEEPIGSVNIYFSQIRKYPLLTEQEELMVMKGIKEHHENIFYAVCNYEPVLEGEDNFGLAAIKGRIRKRYSVKKREEILKEGIGSLGKNDTYRTISELEDLLDQPEIDKEKIYGQMFESLYFPEDTLGQINREIKYGLEHEHENEDGEESEDEKRVNSYREVIRNTATSIISRIRDDIYFYENEMEKTAETETKDGYKKKINEALIKKGYLQTQLRKELQLRNEFINRNVRLVINRAKSYVDRGVPLESLIQEGNLGIMKAIEGFNYTMGYKFSTFAVPTLRQSLERALAKYGKVIHVPVHVHELREQCYSAEIDLMKIIERKPRLDELARYMYGHTLTDKAKEKITFEGLLVALKRCKMLDQYDYSLDHKFKNHFGEIVLIERTKTMEQLAKRKNNVTPEKVYVKRELSEHIKEALATLTPREERIIRKRFGIGFDQTYTLEEIRDDFGVTRERIRQIEAKALEKLRLPSRKEKLKQFWE